MHFIDARLAELGIVLPPAPMPAANYVPFVRSGALIFVSGQLPMGPKGLEYTGILGGGVDAATGAIAAQLCAVNVLAVLKGALGDWSAFRRVVKLTGFVAAAPSFTEHPEVINGASDLMAAVFGENGRHARAAIGCSSLPRGAAVEVEAIFETA